MRHLTPAERQALTALLSDAGAPEVIRTVASWIKNNVEDLATADALGSQLLRTAKAIAEAQSKATA